MGGALLITGEIEHHQAITSHKITESNIIMVIGAVIFAVSAAAAWQAHRKIHQIEEAHKLETLEHRLLRESIRPPK